VAVAIAKMKQEGELSNVTNKLEFNVVELSDLMGWDSSPVKKELKMLEWILGQSAVFRVVNWHDSSTVRCPVKNSASYQSLTVRLGATTHTPSSLLAVTKACYC